MNEQICLNRSLQPVVDIGVQETHVHGLIRAQAGVGSFRRVSRTGALHSTPKCDTAVAGKWGHSAVMRRGRPPGSQSKAVSQPTPSAAQPRTNSRALAQEMKSQTCARTRWSPDSWVSRVRNLRGEAQTRRVRRGGLGQPRNL